MVALLIAALVALVLIGLGWALLAPAGALYTVPADAADPGLPLDRDPVGQDLDAVSFGLAFRGYRMSEVDQTLDQLRDALNERDARIAELQQALASRRSRRLTPGPDTGWAEPGPSATGSGE